MTEEVIAMVRERVVSPCDTFARMIWRGARIYANTESADVPDATF